MPDNPTFVVTGATSGIGLALAHALVRTAGRLVFVGRDPVRLQATMIELEAHARSGVELIPIRADLSTLAGCHRLAEQLERLTRLDVLVHNAGILPTRLRITADGFEESFATNHLSAFVLNQLLRQRLLASAPSRVVQVSAGLAFRGSIDLEGDPRGAHFEPFSTYATTKLWNLVATLELARQLAGSGVVVNSVHPGVVSTRLGEDSSGGPGAIPRLAKHGLLSPEEGARGPFHLATAPELAHTNGRFFDQLDEVPLDYRTTGPALAKAVVQRTIEVLEKTSSQDFH